MNFNEIGPNIHAPQEAVEGQQLEQNEGISENQNIIQSLGTIRHATPSITQPAKDSQQRSVLLTLIMGILAATIGIVYAPKENVPLTTKLGFTAAALGTLLFAIAIYKWSKPPSIDPLVKTHHSAVFNREIIPKQTKTAIEEEVKSYIHNYLRRFNTTFDINSNENQITSHLVSVMCNYKCPLKEKLRVVNTVLKQFERNMATISDRVRNDIEEISEIFFEEKPCELVKIEMTGGETHHAGRVACFLTFLVTEGGRRVEKKIMYKPRDLRIDASITSDSPNSLFSILNQQLGVRMPTYHFLTKQDTSTHEQYGYSEFLTNEPGDYTLNPDQAREYYLTMGRMQAISQIFGIYDLHYENVIAHNKLPYFVDLETAFDFDIDRGTSLELAITVFKENKGEHDKRTTCAVVYTDPEDNEIQNDGNHIRRHCAFIAEGFRDISDACRENEQLRRQLSEYLDGLPSDLRGRFVPISTSQYIDWLSHLSPSIPSNRKVIERKNPIAATSVYDAAHMLVSRVQPTQDPPEDLVDQIAEEFQHDFMQHDVPSLQINIPDGRLSLNGRFIGIHPNPITRIKEAIVNPPPFDPRLHAHINDPRNWEVFEDE